MDHQASTIVRTYIAGIRPFIGEFSDLVRFLTEIEDITPTLSTLSELEIHIRFKQILSKLEGPARDILQENPERWDQVRNLLIRTYSDPLDLGTQILQMERINFTHSILQTYQLLRTAQTRMVDKITLSHDTIEEKELMKSTVKRKTYLQFRKSLPQACQGALTNRGCTTLLDAIQVLQEEDFIHYNRYHDDRRIPRLMNPQHHRQSPNINSSSPRNITHHSPNNHAQPNRPYLPPNDRHHNQPRQNDRRHHNQNYNRNNNFPNNMQNRYPRQPGQYSTQSRRNNTNLAEPMEIDQNFHLGASHQRTINPPTVFPTSGCASEDWDTL